MLGLGWLTIRQAQEALKSGQLEEAHRLLCQSGVHGHKKTFELMHQVGRAFVERGDKHLKGDDPESAWGDLLLAEQLGMKDDPAAISLRQSLTKLGLAEARGMLVNGEPGRAADYVELLRQRSIRVADLQLLEGAAKEWVQARDLANRGEFTLAQQAGERLKKMLPIPGVERFLEELRERRETCAGALVELHEAADQGQWRRAMAIADKVLAVAPQQKEARRARERAWKVVEPPTVDMPGRTRIEERAEPKGDRFLLWIDGVGGFLVCLGTRVTIGQGTPDAAVDVPLFADLSRHHAALTRDSEGYLLEASRAVQVNGKPAEKALLRSGDRLTLGASCQLLFQQPAPVSASARLDLASGHRLPLAFDAVLLMADTLVLGPGNQVHVTVPDAKENIILFRQKEGLGIRCGGKFTIDGRACTERGTLTATSRVSGEDFALAVEPAGMRLGK